MQKSERQKLIIDLISISPITKQKTIVEELRQKGLQVTQASVSRDLDELRILKRNGVYVQDGPNATEVSPFGRIKFALSGTNLIVARCSPGMASAMAVRIESIGIKQIVGTIAGDDTIFIAIEKHEDLKQTLNALESEFKKNV